MKKPMVQTLPASRFQSIRPALAGTPLLPFPIIAAADTGKRFMLIPKGQNVSPISQFRSIGSKNTKSSRMRSGATGMKSLPLILPATPQFVSGLTLVPINSQPSCTSFSLPCSSLAQPVNSTGNENTLPQSSSKSKRRVRQPKSGRYI